MPPDKIGRVMSIDSTLSMMIMPIGALLSGLFSEFLGLTFILNFFAAFCYKLLGFLLHVVSLMIPQGIYLKLHVKLL